MKETMAAFLSASLLLVAATGCGGKAPPGREAAAVLIVLGNEPLDDKTPTVDTIARVNAAVAFYREHPDTVLVFSGGPTAGKTTEARMMAQMAIAQGVSTNSICLEEKSGSTQANAFFTAGTVRRLAPRRILIVSKQDHIGWAMPIFKKIPAFKNAEPLACQVRREDSIAQMEEYLKTHDSARVRERLQLLKDGVQGTD